jgi:hypothetical protein
MKFRLAMTEFHGAFLANLRFDAGFAEYNGDIEQ